MASAGVLVLSETEADSTDDQSPTSLRDDSDNEQYRAMAEEELKLEKAIKSGYLKKKGEHRRVL